MCFVAELGALFFFQDSNAKREEDKDDTRRDIFLPRYSRAKRNDVSEVLNASFEETKDKRGPSGTDSIIYIGPLGSDSIIYITVI